MYTEDQKGLFREILHRIEDNLQQFVGEAIRPAKIAEMKQVVIRQMNDYLETYYNCTGDLLGKSSFEVKCEADPDDSSKMRVEIVAHTECAQDFMDKIKLSADGKEFKI